MTRMKRCTAAIRRRAAHLRLLPAVILRPAPPPVPLPTLASPRPPARRRLLIDAARVILGAGLFTVAASLHWDAGHRIGIQRSDHVLVVRATAGGDRFVGAGGSLALPAAHRQMSGMKTTTTVLLAADVDEKTLLVCSVNVIGSHINDLYTRTVGEPHMAVDRDRLAAAAEPSPTSASPSPTCKPTSTDSRSRQLPPTCHRSWPQPARDSRTYSHYWNRMVTVFGDRPLDQVAASDVEALQRAVTTAAVSRRNSRDGRYAGELFIAAARAFYNRQRRGSHRRRRQPGPQNLQTVAFPDRTTTPSSRRPGTLSDERQDVLLT